MKKYMLAYFILWLPAVLVAYLYNNAEMLSQILQWSFAVLMVLGWSVNTGLMAYRYPRTALSLVFFYVGLTVLAITLKYSSESGTPLHQFMRVWGGILSYKPLEIFIMALRDFNIPHEMYLMGAVVLLCLVGYLVGLAYRRVRPDPYSPRIVDGLK